MDYLVTNIGDGPANAVLDTVLSVSKGQYGISHVRICGRTVELSPEAFATIAKSDPDAYVRVDDNGDAVTIGEIKYQVALEFEGLVRHIADTTGGHPCDVRAWLGGESLDFSPSELPRLLAAWNDGK